MMNRPLPPLGHTRPVLHNPIVLIRQLKHPAVFELCAGRRNLRVALSVTTSCLTQWRKFARSADNIDFMILLQSIFYVRLSLVRFISVTELQTQVQHEFVGCVWMGAVGVGFALTVSLRT